MASSASKIQIGGRKGGRASNDDQVPNALPPIRCIYSDIREFYDINDDDVLGEGIQGVVRTVVNKKTGIKFAMKTVPLGAGKVR